MRKLKISVAILPLFCCMALSAQDSVINRNVTVERDFQPVIQAAGKVNTRPELREMAVEAVDVEYSNYTSSLAPDFNVTSLLSQPTRFQTGKAPDGYLRVGVGHTSTVLDFNYLLRDGKRSTLNIYAEHEACWGRKALEQTKIGLSYKHNLSECTLYFNVDGSNEFYSRYGRYYDGNKGLMVEHFSEMKDKKTAEGGLVSITQDRQTIWTVGGQFGVCSKAGSDIVYDVNIGYNAYRLENWAVEHQVKTNAKIAYAMGDHLVGMNWKMQNNIHKLQTHLPLAVTLSNTPRHFIRMEPYYEYQTKKFQVHAGVNLDIVAGKGQLLSAAEDVAFAPSPNLHIEGQVAKWMTIYAKAEGRISNGSIQSAVNANRYTRMMPILYSHHVGPYTPVDAEVGFHIRPERNLLIEIHGGYAYMMNVKTNFAVVDTTFMGGTGLRDGQLDYFYTKQDCWKIGGALAYHYRDIIDLHVWGDYFFWNIYDAEFGSDAEGNDRTYFPATHYPNYSLKEGRVYDRPNWMVGARLDGYIDKNWSLYTVFTASGARWAAVGTALPLKEDLKKTNTVDYASSYDVQLKPIINWNLGAQYTLPKYHLSFFVEVNNLLCRYNDIYYGYQSEGTNFLLGATWRF